VDQHECPDHEEHERIRKIIYGNGEPGLKGNVESLMADREELKIDRREGKAFRRNVLGSLIAGIILLLAGEGLIYARPQPQVTSTTQNSGGDSTRTTVGK
jgi:hypothetical protein